MFQQNCRVNKQIDLLFFNSRFPIPEISRVANRGLYCQCASAVQPYVRTALLSALLTPLGMARFTAQSIKEIHEGNRNDVVVDKKSPRFFRWAV